MHSAHATDVIEQERPTLTDQARQHHPIALVDERRSEMRAQGRWGRQIIAGMPGTFGYSVLLSTLLLIVRLVGVDLGRADAARVGSMEQRRATSSGLDNRS